MPMESCLHNGLILTAITSAKTVLHREPCVAYPSINVPFTSSYGFITPKLGLHTSSYQLNDNDFNVNGSLQSENSLTRTLPMFSLDTGLFFDKESTFLDTNYTQTIEPRLFYVYIPYDDQSKIAGI
jgi:LPS-assembly protein